MTTSTKASWLPRPKCIQRNSISQSINLTSWIDSERCKERSHDDDVAA
jgi:hypothetical protein